MQSALQSLLLCADDKVVRVLRRVLSELEIGVEVCEDVDSAVRKLTRQRFEAVIVDCTTPEIALKILKGTHSAPANKRAITVAILEGQTTDGHSALKGAFALGAHFVLFKPISLEKTKSSFRAVRALMKRERRRNVRLPIELSVELQVEGRSEKINAVMADLGENGMAVKTRDFKLPPAFRVRFTLPGASAPILCRGEVAWEGRNMHGVRFREMSVEHCDQLKLWISRQLAAIEGDEPPVNCKLTDLSLNACYLQTESPFPVRTRLQLMMKVRKLEVHVEGIVRVMHPGAGMGVEFNQHTTEQRARVEEFIQTLVNTAGAIPDIQVRPDIIDQNAAESSSQLIAGDPGDPLLFLFRIKAELSPQAFQAELAKQRGIPAEVGV